MVLTQSLLRDQHEQSMVLERLRVQARHYPLGEPGRFRESAYSPRPAILISPPPGGTLSPQPGLDELVYDRLRDAPRISQHAELLTGAFVWDSRVPRAVQGAVGAREIAAVEFTSRPAILVYFERHADGLTAFAYVARMFATTDGDWGFPLRIAKFIIHGDSRAEPTAAPLDTDLPTWKLIDVSGFGTAAGEVIAAVVSWFVLSTLDTYWLLQGVPGTRLLASAFGAAGVAPGSGADGAPAGDPFIERLEKEMAGLALAGFEFGEVLPLDGDQVALVVSRNDQTIAFGLQDDFPASPPTVLAFGADGPERLDVNGPDWTPDRRLLEIAEALA